MRTFLGITLLACTTTMTGCASIVSKTQYPVSVHSTPPGANFVIKDKSGIEIHRAQTPSTVSLKSSSGFFSAAKYQIEFQKDGYHNGAASTNGSIDGWYFGNILLGGLLGMLIIDPATGAMWKLDNSVSASLAENENFVMKKPGTPELNEKQTDIPVHEKLKALKDLRDQDILSHEEYETKRMLLVEHL